MLWEYKYTYLGGKNEKKKLERRQSHTHCTVHSAHIQHTCRVHLWFTSHRCDVIVTHTHTRHQRAQRYFVSERHKPFFQSAPHPHWNGLHSWASCLFDQCQSSQLSKLIRVRSNRFAVYRNVSWIYRLEKCLQKCCCWFPHIRLALNIYIFLFVHFCTNND